MSKTNFHAQFAIILVALVIITPAFAEMGPKNGDTWQPNLTGHAPEVANPLIVTDVVVDKSDKDWDSLPKEKRREKVFVALKIKENDISSDVPKTLEGVRAVFGFPWVKRGHINFVSDFLAGRVTCKHCDGMSNRAGFVQTIYTSMTQHEKATTAKGKPGKHQAQVDASVQSAINADARAKKQAAGASSGKAPPPPSGKGMLQLDLRQAGMNMVDKLLL